MPCANWLKERLVNSRVSLIMNGWVLVGSMPALVGTDYGRLLLVKVALVTVASQASDTVAPGLLKLA